MSATLVAEPTQSTPPYRAAEDLSGFDAIVIGSGLGSLTTAAVLARQAGRRVLVLERHYVAGGYTHVFKRPGCEWDVGVHYVGDVSDPTRGLARLLSYIMQEGVEWAPMAPVYDRLVCQGESFDFVAGSDGFVEAMAGYFPRERRAIQHYVALLKECQSAAQRYFAEKAIPPWLATLVGPLLRRRFARLASRTTYDVLRGLTDSQKLIGVLTTQWGDYGLPPRASSFGAHALVAQHYLRGAAYPVGGASRIAAAIRPVIEAAGGKLLIRAEVRSILIERGRAVGVEMADGRQIRAPLVISGVGLRGTAGSLLAPEHAARLKIQAVLDQVPPSCAMVCLFVALDGDDRELAFERTNLWACPTFDHDRNLARYTADPSQPFPMVYLSFQSAKDPSFASRYPRTAAVQVLAPVSYERFRGWEPSDRKHRGSDYAALKAELTDRLLERLYEHVPQTRGRVKHAELGTPLSTRHFAGHAQGETYGLAHSPERFLFRVPRPRTGIAGFYLTGVDIAMCGIGGALSSGYMTASAVLGRNAMATALRAPARPLMPAAELGQLSG